jgi:nucleoid-associated protein YgaU
MASFDRKSRYKEYGLVVHFEFDTIDRTLDSSPSKSSIVCLRRSTHYYSTLETLTHVVKPGESIHSLARNYYKDARLWWFIADYNPKVDVFNLKEDDELIIPPNTEVASY